MSRALLSCALLALAACGGAPDCEPCDEPPSLTQALPACDPYGCQGDPSPYPVPLSLEIRNEWPEDNRFTVAARPGPLDTTESIVLVFEWPLAAFEMKRTHTSLSVWPGQEVYFQLGRTMYHYVTDWAAFSVPASARPEDGITLVYHFATNTTTPACPNGQPNCLLVWWSWAGRTTSPRAVSLYRAD